MEDETITLKWERFDHKIRWTTVNLKIIESIDDIVELTLNKDFEIK